MCFVLLNNLLFYVIFEVLLYIKLNIIDCTRWYWYHATSNSTVCCQVEFHARGHPYLIDLNAMAQINLNTGMQRVTGRKNHTVYVVKVGKKPLSNQHFISLFGFYIMNLISISL